ncbi:hypothetical protein ACQ4LE_002263 [Meloidogyne hapla]|uniref:Ovule protein n=1 Tax=Meloidogyne hapla TaxID=6305 RepID=A0A1I8AYV4_MELHA
MTSEQDEQLVQEIIGKVMDLAIKENEDSKISGSETNIDEHSEDELDKSLVASPRLEENKLDIIDSPRPDEGVAIVYGEGTNEGGEEDVVVEVMDPAIKENEDSKISGYEPNIDGHSEENKLDNSLVGSPRLEENKLDIVDSPRHDGTVSGEGTNEVNEGSEDVKKDVVVDRSTPINEHLDDTDGSEDVKSSTAADQQVVADHQAADQQTKVGQKPRTKFCSLL